jgi:hypothetical protein
MIFKRGCVTKAIIRSDTTLVRNINIDHHPVSERVLMADRSFGSGSS